MRNAYWDYFKYLVRGLPEPSSEQFDFLKEGMLVFDIGSNLGNYSSLFLKKGCKVIALEPQDYCFRFLSLRFRSDSNITRIKKGAGAENESRELFLSTSHTLSSMNKEWIGKVSETNRFEESGPQWNKTKKVELVTLDSLITEYGVPDYIKIDVEGFETETLRGLSKPVRFISFEYTIPELTDSARDCITLISALGNYSFSLENGIWSSREEILKELNKMSKVNSLLNGDIFCRLEY